MHGNAGIYVEDEKLQWLRKSHRMDENEIPKQALTLTWYPEQGNRRPGKPRKSCIGRGPTQYWDAMGRLRSNCKLC